MTHRTLTEEQSEKLARLMIMMEVPKEMSLDILTVVETNEELLTFLDKLSAKNYDMTPEEVYHRNILIEKDSWIIRDTAFVKMLMDGKICLPG